MVWSVVALLAATMLLLGGLVLLRSGMTTPGQSGAGKADDGASASAEPVAGRPDCPAADVGGVALPCLGGAVGEGGSAGITVVNVWAWWCQPCREELPVIEQFARQHPDYSVVGVHADRSAAKGAALLNDLGVGMPSYQDDDNRFAGALGLPGVIPVTVVFRDGAKVAVFPRAFRSVDELDRAVAEVV